MFADLKNKTKGGKRERPPTWGQGSFDRCHIALTD